jgi:hypothetical protein
MFELSSSIRLCMDIGNLFELQGTFHGDVPVKATADKEGVFDIQEVLDEAEHIKEFAKSFVSNL